MEANDDLEKKDICYYFHEIVRFDPETSKCWDSHYETLGGAKWTSLPTGNITASSNGKKWKKGLI